MERPDGIRPRPGLVRHCPVDHKAQLGNRVELITTLERRLELLAEAGIAETLVAAFTPEFMRLSPEEFVAIGRVARERGFALVSATPMTRSSYHADEDFQTLRARREAGR